MTDSFDFNPGESISEIVQRRIKASDFAIAVLGNARNQNVFYEMGLCQGLGKPMLILIPPEIDPPSFIQSKIYLRTAPVDMRLLEVAITGFLAKLKTGPTRSPRKTKAKDRDSWNKYLNNILERMPAIRQEASGRDVEHYAAELFKILKLEAVANEFRSGDKGVDFAVWSDALTSALGNPLFIDIKSGNLSSENIRRSEERLRNYMVSSGAKAALLLYLDRDGKRFENDYSVAPLILRLDFEDFLRALLQSGFEELILKRRNEIVHGVEK